MIKKIIAAIIIVASTSTFAVEKIIKLGTANVLNIRGEISSESMDKASKELLRLDKLRNGADYPIFIHFDSPGGEIMAGEDFIQVAKTIPNVHTITSFAASMASAIVEALPGNRYILSNGVLMFHRAKGGVSGQFEDGELESRLAFYKSFVRNMEIRNAKRMEIPLSYYKQLVKDELWMTSERAIGMRAADEVVSIKCSDALLNKKGVETAFFLIFRIEVEFSYCPLIKSVEPVKEADDRLKELYKKYGHMEAIK